MVVVSISEPLFKSSMKNYLKDRIGELHNITWPTRKHAVHSMILVLVIMLIVGVFLGVVDYLLNQAVLGSFKLF